LKSVLKHIKAKPDMVIAVGVKSLDTLGKILPRLRDIGIGPMKQQSLPGTVLCAIISEGDSGVHSQYIHVIEYGSTPWQDYIAFRDYMNAFPHKAAEYEGLKTSLAERFPNDRKAYKAGKVAFFERTLADAMSI